MAKAKPSAVRLPGSGRRSERPPSAVSVPGSAADGPSRRDGHAIRSGRTIPPPFSTPAQQSWMVPHSRLDKLEGPLESDAALLACRGVWRVAACAHQGHRTAASGMLRWQMWQSLDLGMISPAPGRNPASNRRNELLMARRIRLLGRAPHPPGGGICFQHFLISQPRHIINLGIAGDSARAVTCDPLYRIKGTG